MGEPDLIYWVIEDANSMGEDFNDGDERPGWLTSRWTDEGLLEITYENPANEKTTAWYRITKVED